MKFYSVLATTQEISFLIRKLIMERGVYGAEFYFSAIFLYSVFYPDYLITLKRKEV
jgi:hypothetical protein